PQYTHSRLYLLSLLFSPLFLFFFFFFNDPPTTDIYTLSLHDALPISSSRSGRSLLRSRGPIAHGERDRRQRQKAQLIGTLRRLRDRKSTRLNSSHDQISYAVFCLKKKKNQY